MHQSFPNSSLEEPRWCLLTAFDSVQNAQFYKKDCKPTPMLADSCVQDWGQLHRDAVQEAGGDLKKTMQLMRTRHGGVAAVRPRMLRGADDLEGDNHERNWDDTKKKLYPADSEALAKARL